MIQRKVCLLGAHAVGKTSLAQRSVRGVFDERYLTTVGVRVDRLTIDGRTLVLWDLHGEDRFKQVEPSYLRGAHGLVFAFDPTRPATLDALVALEARLAPLIDALPRVVVATKADLAPAWAVEREGFAARLGARLASAPIHVTSAKTGEGVEAAFSALAQGLA
jgi:small GTP-binding protein